MAEEVICALCNGPVTKDPNYRGVWWCPKCDTSVPVMPKPAPPCPFCRGTGKRGTGLGYHDVEEFYPEDPKPMKCPKCNRPLEKDYLDMDERWEELVVRIPEMTFIEKGPDGERALTRYTLKELKESHSTHICPHCHCIVLRCEE